MDTVTCENECLNDGVCNSSTNQCECPFGCFGEICENCPLYSPWTIAILIFLLLVSICYTIYHCVKDRYVVELFKVKRYMKIGEPVDPFLSNLHSMTESATIKNSTLGSSTIDEDNELYKNPIQWWKHNTTPTPRLTGNTPETIQKPLKLVTVDTVPTSSESINIISKSVEDTQVNSTNVSKQNNE
ncbi:hypothetical protein WA158_003731 [Blastocystis sp. Blastoise]